MYPFRDAYGIPIAGTGTIMSTAPFRFSIYNRLNQPTTDHIGPCSSSSIRNPIFLSPLWIAYLSSKGMCLTYSQTIATYKKGIISRDTLRNVRQITQGPDRLSFCYLVDCPSGIIVLETNYIDTFGLLTKVLKFTVDSCRAMTLR